MKTTTISVWEWIRPTPDLGKIYGELKTTSIKELLKRQPYAMSPNGRRTCMTAA